MKLDIIGLMCEVSVSESPADPRFFDSKWVSCSLSVPNSGGVMCLRQGVFYEPDYLLGKVRLLQAQLGDLEKMLLDKIAEAEKS